MECGSGVTLCGLLTMETGRGPGAYHHKDVHVHGLWPEVGNYGSSKCIPPQSSAEPTKIFSCYQQDEVSQDDLLNFERHEWDKHGACSGAKDAEDFFTQVCSLAEAPVKLMEDSRSAGKYVKDIAEDLKKAGYPVWQVDEVDRQVSLSVCAGADGRWVIAEVSDFPSRCGGGGPSPPSPPSPTPPSPSPAGTCVPGKHGPRCHEDSDCEGLDGCVRCAHGRFCTDIRPPSGELVV